MLRNRQAPSRASPQTLCQKCLKRDDYECKATIQDRPYRARPSRSQQLANPKLAPKLNSDQPNELLRKKGVADEQLAKAEAERKRAQDNIGRRSRSASSSSVATISTKSSASPERRHEVSEPEPSRKRRRRSSSSSKSSAASKSSRGGRPLKKDKSIRRRYSTASPISRGRKAQQESPKDRTSSSRSRG